MRKNLVQQVMVHIPEQGNVPFFSAKLCDFYFGMVQGQLDASGLTPQEKIAVVDQLLDHLSKRGNGGSLP